METGYARSIPSSISVALQSSGDRAQVGAVEVGVGDRFSTHGWPTCPA